MVAKLPLAGNLAAEVASYLEFLDRALEDRRITEEEAEGLVGVARELGLSTWFHK
jgi:hypothetical protein